MQYLLRSNFYYIEKFVISYVYTYVCTYVRWSYLYDNIKKLK